MENENQNPPPTSPQGPYQPLVPKADGTSATMVSEGASDEPDDSLLQSASNGVGDEMGVPPPNDFGSKPKKGKKFLLVLLALLLIGGGAAAYYFLVYSKPAEAPAPAPQAEVPAQTFTPENVAYAFREKDADPYMLYLRPVIGSDRVEAGELGKEDSGVSSDVYGQNVAVLFDNKLQISTDGGKTYTQILAPEADQEITGFAFNTTGTNLGVAVLNTDKGENTVSSIGLDGQNTTEIFTSKDHKGIDIMGWGDASVMFQAYVPNSDGGSLNPYQYSIESKKVKQLIEVNDSLQILSVAVSDDLTKLVYSSGEEDTAGDDPFALPLAPHTISVLDVESGGSKVMSEVGKADEKAPNGTAKQRNTMVGFLVNSSDIYFTDDAKLFTQSNDGIAMLHAEANTEIQSVFFVNKLQSIVYDSKNLLVAIDIQPSKITTILEGDENTVIFGITTK